MVEKKRTATTELMTVCMIQTKSPGSQNIKETIYKLLNLEAKK